MDDFMTVAEASKITGFTPHYIRKLFNDGKIEGRIIDSHYFIKRESLFNFLRKRREVATNMSGIQSLPTKISIDNRRNESIPSISEQIIEIENRFSGDALVYISQFGKSGSIIIPNDGMTFDDFLNGMDARFPGKEKKFKKIILYISSPGGLLEASIKIVDIIKQYAESFEVIVPYMAKSAASLICLYADLIYMTTISELGPIDPIIENPAKPGQMIPARAIDDFIKYYSANAESEGPLANSLSKIFENKIDPYLLGSRKNALRYSQREIERAISGKVDPSKIENIVNIFTTADISHSHPITYNDLKEIGITNIKQITGEDLPCIKRLFTSFNDYIGTNRLVKIVGNRYQCFNVKEAKEDEKP